MYYNEIASYVEHTGWTFTLVIGLILVVYYTWLSKRRNLPPGPRGLPLIGNVHQIPRNIPIYHILRTWAKKYGPLYRMYFGYDMAIIINDPKLIREAFNNPLLNGRPTDKVFKAISAGDYGVIGTAGSPWADQRRFTLRHLRNFGFGKTGMEPLITDEAKELLETFRSHNGKPFDPSHNFNLAILNALWFIVTGNRFNQDDTNVRDAISAYFKALDDAFVTGQVGSFPFLADIAPELSGYNSLVRVMKSTHDFFRSIVNEHEQSFKSGEEPRDYIDAYLTEIRNASEMPGSSFYGETGYRNLLAIIGDFFSAGSETTSTTLSWTVLYLALNQEVQHKLQDEIDRVVGNSRLPSLADKPNMPYTEAVMYEVFRMSSIVSMGLPHRAIEDVTLGGYDIPKDALLFANLKWVHNNPDLWDEPEKFKPERFLTNESEDGLLHVQKSDNLMPFSTGKRTCLGESLARDEFFLFLTVIFQRLNVITNPACKTITVEPQTSFIDKPHPFEVIMTERIQ